MTRASVLSPATLHAAIEKGLAYLAQTQRPSGEFATYNSSHPDMAEAKEVAKSVYVTTFVTHALCYLPANSLIHSIQHYARDFLLQEQEDNGSWHYDGQSDQRTIPTDLDDTCCATAALLQLGHRPSPSFFSLLWQNEVAPSGPYYTWIGVARCPDDDSMNVDCLVNANISFCCGLLNFDLPGTTDYLRRVVKDEAYLTQGIYCVSPHFPIYTISRAYSDGQVESLAPALLTMQDYILTKLPSPESEPSAFNLACAAVSLLNLGAPLLMVESYLTSLLSSQHNDGHWPTWAACLSYGLSHDGSPALTTALVLEAIGKYLSRLTQPE